MKGKPVYIQIYDDIMEQINSGALCDMDALPTERELMSKYYVSRITIRNAMNMLASSGHITRIAGKGTFVSSENKVTASGTRRKIGLILCNIGASFGLEILTALERAATKEGYLLIFKNALNDVERESEAIRDLIDDGVDGIIIQPVHGETFNSEIMKLSLSAFPIVVIDRKLKGLSLSFVGTNNFKGAKEATEYLFDHGHTNIAFLSTDVHGSSTLEDRRDGFTQAFIERGIPNTVSNYLLNIETPKGDVDNVIFNNDVHRICEYLHVNPQITALFATEYSVARLAYLATKELGKNVPKDISLVMYDTYEAIDFRITCISQNQEKIAKTAFAKLVSIMNGDATVTETELDCELREGDSVRKLG